MGLEEYKGVFIFAQQVDNEVSSISYELIGKAKDLAKDLNEKVTAVLIGKNVAALADKLAEYGADKVIVVDDPELEVYRTEPYTHAICSVIDKYKPEIMLFGATAIGRDLAPRCAARVHTGLTADCSSLEIGDFPLVPIPGKENEQLHNQLLMTRPAFGGNTIATIACPGFRPQAAGRIIAAGIARDVRTDRTKPRGSHRAVCFRGADPPPVRCDTRHHVADKPVGTERGHRGGKGRGSGKGFCRRGR